MRILGRGASAIAPSAKRQPDCTLAKALARAWRQSRQFVAELYRSLAEIAAAEEASPSVKPAKWPWAAGAELEKRALDGSTANCESTTAKAKSFQVIEANDNPLVGLCDVSGCTGDLCCTWGRASSAAGQVGSEAKLGMELEWFEDFLSVARTGSFSRSAEERSLTQPAFSRRIRALELALGVTLIDRSTYPTRLTPAGRLFRDTAADTLRQVYAVRDELRGAASAPRDFLRFSAMHSLSVSFFPSWLHRLEPALGQLNTRVTSDNMHNCVQQLIDGNCDFLLCYAHPAMPIVLEPDLYPYRVLGQDRLIPVCAGRHGSEPLFRLPGSKEAPLPHLGYSAGSFLGRAVDHILDQSDQRPVLRLCYENALADALKSMALAEHGLAWLPESLIEPDLERQRLVRAGGPEWGLPLEIRLYKAASGTRPEVVGLWSSL